MSDLMRGREQTIRAFLAEHERGQPGITLLARDASFRSYWRIHRLGGDTAVLMDAPPPKEDVNPFLEVDRHLRALGFSAPEILACDMATGLVLLEDFGDDTFSRLLAAGTDEEVLYALAVDLLAELHRLPAGATIFDGLPHFDASLLFEEAVLFVDWYLPETAGTTLPADARESFHAAWREFFEQIASEPTTLTLRDFHVDNLMRLEGRPGIAQCGLLDFQDAVAGPPAYDLMSLLEDARRDISPALKATMRDRYIQAVGLTDVVAFDRVFAILAAQRHAKVIGIFTRLFRRDGKPAYLRHIPRVWRLLEEALSHPALAPVADWFDHHVPRDRRVVPDAAPPLQEMERR